jgi:hypothetical protein
MTSRDFGRRDQYQPTAQRRMVSGFPPGGVAIRLIQVFQILQNG